MIEKIQVQDSLRGKLFVLFGPSGVGKTTLAQAVTERMRGEIVIAVSYTTRKPRPQEKNGVDYWFISQAEFEQKKAEQFFLEESDEYQASYGSSYKDITGELEKGVSVLMVIDRCGVQKIIERVPDAVIIQILPLTIDVLRERLRKRSNILEKDLDFRMQQSEKELNEESENPLARFIVVNIDLEESISKICNIIRGELEA